MIINTITMARHAAELEGLIRHDRACRAPRVLLDRGNDFVRAARGRLPRARSRPRKRPGATLATGASGVKVFVTTHVRHAGDSSGEWYGPKYELWPADESTSPSFHFPLSSVSRAKQFAAFELQLHLYDKDADDAADVPESFWLGGSLRVSVAECGIGGRVRGASKSCALDDDAFDGEAAWSDAGGALPPGWVWTTRDATVAYRKRCADRGQHCDAIRVYSVDVLDALAYGVDATVDFPTELPDALAGGRAIHVRVKPSFHFVDERYSTLQLATSYVGLLLTALVAVHCRGRVRAARAAAARARATAAAAAAALPAARRARAAERDEAFVARWIPGLLLAAAAYDDPFCWFVVHGAWAFWDVLHIALLAGALGAILFFVPCLIDELGAAARVGDAAAAAGDAARGRLARAGRGRDGDARPARRGAGYYIAKATLAAPLGARRGRRIHRRPTALAQTGVPCVGLGLRGHGSARARVPRRARRVLFRVRRAARRAARARVLARAPHAAARRAVAARERGRPRRGRARRGRDRGRAIPVALARL